MTEKRFYVHDRGLGVDANLSRWSAVNPRYWVIDRTTGKAVDESTTKRAAQMAASFYNAHPEAVDA